MHVLFICVILNNPTLGSSDGKEFACNAGDLGPIPGLGRSPGEGNATHSSYFCLENLHGQKSLASYSPWDLKGQT